MRSFKAGATILATVVAFYLGALLVDVAYTHMILRSTWLQAGRIGRIVTHADADEIPMFGASKIVADYIPDILGPHTYNYGLQGTSQAVTNLLLSFEIQKHSRQPIIIDMYQGRLSGIGDVRDYIPYARYPQVEQFLRDAGEWRWYYAVPGLRYFGSYDWYTKGIVSDYTSGRDAIRHGYHPPVSAIAPTRAGFDAAVAARAREQLALGMASDQWNRMVQLIRKAPQRRFAIVLSPLHKSFFVHVTGQKQFQDRLATLAAIPNVRVFDFSRAPYPDAYFEDSAHLDTQGAAVFSGELKQALSHAGF
jgi:uncharacterized protein (DUF2164 family)